MGLYEVYATTLQFRDLLVGGQPKNPKAMREFIMRRMGVEGAEQVRREILRLASEMDIETNPDMSLDDLEALADKLTTFIHKGFPVSKTCSGSQ